MDLLKPSGNKLALKLFESRKGLIKERSRQQRARNCVCRNDFIEEIILEPRLIAINYIKTWFILDLFLSVASMVMRILNLLALIILLAQWNGCLQFMIPMFQNFPSDCWVAFIDP
ncbi:unnamed protein product [Rotaria sp. Silwood2]|nr:unnamed protein product [Rotaria sp. Silwood2]CAF4267253.1 unnamed protein product [Rotaria sp. Silwood2]CAF4458535.1 unnamed protein product [Rotaria sp. Silwood2]